MSVCYKLYGNYLVSIHLRRQQCKQPFCLFTKRRLKPEPSDPGSTIWLQQRGGHTVELQTHSTDFRCQPSVRERQCQRTSADWHCHYQCVSSWSPDHHCHHHNHCRFAYVHNKPLKTRKRNFLEQWEEITGAQRDKAWSHVVNVWNKRLYSTPSKKKQENT